VRNSSDLTGFPLQISHPVKLPGEVPDRPLSLAWMTDELIAETQRVWSPHYGRDLSPNEAVEILRNVKRFAEILVTSERERSRS
jgi:hypothetical protein